MRRARMVLTEKLVEEKYKDRDRNYRNTDEGSTE